MKSIMLLMATLLISCAQSGGSGGGQSTSPASDTSVKSLQSQWSNSSYSLDLTALNPGSASSVALTFPSGGVCELTLNVQNDPDVCSVNAIDCELGYVSASTYSGGGGSDPGCSSLVSPNTDDYTISLSPLSELMFCVGPSLGICLDLF
jgi:hypothetical protein